MITTQCVHVWKWKGRGEGYCLLVHKGMSHLVAAGRDFWQEIDKCFADPAVSNSQHTCCVIHNPVSWSSLLQVLPSGQTCHLVRVQVPPISRPRGDWLHMEWASLDMRMDKPSNSTTHGLGREGVNLRPRPSYACKFWTPQAPYLPWSSSSIWSYH